MPPSQALAEQMVQCQSAAMQQLHAACRDSIGQIQAQTYKLSVNALRSRTVGSSGRPARHTHLQDMLCKDLNILQPPKQQYQQQLRQLHTLHANSSGGCSSSMRQLYGVQPFRQLLPHEASSATCTGKLHLFSNPSHLRIAVPYYDQVLRPFRSQCANFSRTFSSSSRSKACAPAEAWLPGSNSSSRSRWRLWMQQQLSASSSSNARNLYQQTLHRRSSAAAAAGLAAYRAAASNAAAAANLAATLRIAAANGSSALTARAAAAAGWFDSWTLWVDRTSGFLLSSMLNALNLVGNKLPAALGLLLVDMAHNSPMLGGSRADSLQLPYLPDQLPKGGFYANGGLAAEAAADSKQRAYLDHRSLLTFVQGFWSEASAAAAAGARLIWLGFIWLPAAVTAPAALWWGVGRDWWLVLLRLSLEVSGPAFIKWGQWAATRHDLFAQDVCNALEQLHTNAPAHSFRYTCTQLRKSFGLPPSELFDWIEDAPIACGSIGQVHRGRLSQKGAALTGCAVGDLVAIKVRHPGVSDAIERDFQTMVWLAHVAGQLLPAARTLRLDDTLKQFAAPLHEQVDLSREAANLQRFNKNFKRTRAVSFPLPLYPLVSPDVLVESFEAGRHISYYIAAAEGSHPYRSRLAELGSGTMLQMMLVDNLIHSDLHPGNILVRLEPPAGLLGMAYRTLSSLANPDGPAMRAVARTLEKLQVQAGKSDQSSGGGSSSRELSQPLPAEVDQRDQALTVSLSGSGSCGPRSSRWYDLQQQWSNVCAAAADPAALLSKVQGVLNQITAAWLQPHIVLLDVGMATELTGDDQTNMVGLFRAFAGLNGADVAQWVLRFSGSEQGCPKPQDFIDDMQVTFEALKKTIAAHQAAEARWKQQQQQQQQQQQVTSISNSSSSLSESGTGLIEMPEQFDSGAEALATVLELVRVHGVSLPGHICAVVVTTLILEGWSNKLAPEHSVLAQVQGMFSPAMYSWHDRMDSVVDIVMDRGDTALLLA